MYQQFMNMLSPKKVLRNRTILQTPVKKEEEDDEKDVPSSQLQPSKSTVASQDMAATSNYLTHTKLELDFTNLPDLSQYSIDTWILLWQQYHNQHGIKMAISCISLGDFIIMRLRETPIDQEELISEADFKSMFTTNEEFLEYLENWNITTTLTSTKNFAQSKMKMVACDQYSIFTEKNLNTHVSHFLAVVDNKRVMLKNLNCTEKDKALALINSLQPLILRSQVAELNGKTIRAVVKHIYSVMALLAIHYDISLKVNNKNKQNKNCIIRFVQAFVYYHFNCYSRWI